jgi:hypothetical protein
MNNISVTAKAAKTPFIKKSITLRPAFNPFVAKSVIPAFSKTTTKITAYTTKNV